MHAEVATAEWNSPKKAGWEPKSLGTAELDVSKKRERPNKHKVKTQSTLMSKKSARLQSGLHVCDTQFDTVKRSVDDKYT